MKRYLVFLLVFFTLSKAILSLDSSPEQQAIILNRRGVAILESSPEKALEYFKQAHSLDKKPARYIVNIGVAHLRRNQHKQALYYFKKAVQSKPNNVRALFTLGAYYQYIKQYRKAIPLYNKAITLAPKYWKPYNNLGGLYEKLGDKQKAISNLKKFIQVAPKYVATHIADAKRRIRELSK